MWRANMHGHLHVMQRHAPPVRGLQFFEAKAPSFALTPGDCEAAAHMGAAPAPDVPAFSTSSSFSRIWSDQHSGSRYHLGC